MMVSAIFSAAMGMIGVFAFLLFFVLSFFALLPFLGSIYYLITELCKRIKSKSD